LKVIVCEAPPGGTPTAADIGELIASRIDRVPRAREMIKPSTMGLRAPSWVECTEFNVSNQVFPVEQSGPLREEELLRVISELMPERLPRDRPLWRLDVVEETADGGFALILRVHHAMADGVTALRMVRELLFDDPDPRAAAPSTAGASAPHRSGGASGWAPATHGGVFDGIRSAYRELRRTGAASPFARKVGHRRAVAFARADLEELKRAGKAISPDVTLNDVVLAACGGGLRRWLEAHHASEEGIRVKVPVSLHNKDHDAHALGNRDSFMFVDLPLAEADPAARVLAINAQTLDRKRHHDAQSLDTLFRDLHRLDLDEPVQRWLSDPRAFTVNISNVPGPRDPVAIMGAEMRELLFLAEIGQMHALRISVISAAGKMFFGLAADPEVVPDLDSIAAGIEAEIEDLKAAA
jgi:WS/DGAT/MGAT family acyltransferase